MIERYANDGLEFDRLKEEYRAKGYTVKEKLYWLAVLLDEDGKEVGMITFIPSTL